MLAEKGVIQSGEMSGKSEPPIAPITSSEYVTTLAHYYRGEVARMQSWRDRIDRTTNWAITVTAALLSVSLSSPTAHHSVLLFAMLLVYLLLTIESRRYRFFDVYRRRVRSMERNYYAAIFTGDHMAEAEWMRELGRDIRLPRFYVSLSEAMARRMRRNYGYIFLMLLLAWVLKTTTKTLELKDGSVMFVHSAGEFFQKAQVAYIPGWLVAAGVLVFFGWLGYIALKYRTSQGELSYGQVHL